MIGSTAGTIRIADDMVLIQHICLKQTDPIAPERDGGDYTAPYKTGSLRHLAPKAPGFLIFSVAPSVPESFPVRSGGFR